MPRHTSPVEQSDGVDDIADGRLRRGARARREVAECAARVASEEGLTGLSIGRVARELSLGKSTIQTLFPTKEAVQLAAIDSARDTFVRTVVEPAESARPGRPRLRALTERWLDYAQEPVFPGGCFWTANMADLDGRPGPVRDALFEHHRRWLDRLAEQVRTSGDHRDPQLVAFQLDAVLSAANIRLRTGDTAAVSTARQAIRAILRPPTP